VKFQLLPSTIDENGRASARQHLTCFIIDDLVAFDAGSLAMAATQIHRDQIRDIVLTHAHLDHIAGLPLFVDDLFAVLETPIRVHASPEVIEIIERDVFNWHVYPSFSELTNEFGPVLEYFPFSIGRSFNAGHLTITPSAVNHKVPTAGFVIDDGTTAIAITGDTAETNAFWPSISEIERLSAIFIECAFPDEMADLAAISHHLTPSSLKTELSKFTGRRCPIYLINLKPMYREQIAKEIASLEIADLSILEVGKVYEF